jgi:hypothetical protein
MVMRSRTVADDRHCGIYLWRKYGVSLVFYKKTDSMEILYVTQVVGCTCRDLVIGIELLGVYTDEMCHSESTVWCVHQSRNYPDSGMH